MLPPSKIQILKHANDNFTTAETYASLSLEEKEVLAKENRRKLIEIQNSYIDETYGPELLDLIKYINNSNFVDFSIIFNKGKEFVRTDSIYGNGYIPVGIWNYLNSKYESGVLERRDTPIGEFEKAQRGKVKTDYENFYISESEDGSEFDDAKENELRFLNEINKLQGDNNVEFRFKADKTD